MHTLSPNPTRARGTRAAPTDRLHPRRLGRFLSTLERPIAGAVVVLASLVLFASHAVAGTPDKVYWIESAVTDEIRRSNLDGTNVETILSPADGLSAPHGIAIDHVGGKMYWTDFGQDKIQRANLDGTNIEDLVTAADGVSFPKGIALDLVAGKMYWVDTTTSQIHRANLDGTAKEDVLLIGFPGGGIALDVPNQKMYWTQLTGSGVSRADFDGTNVEGLTGFQPNGLALDLPNGHMYIASLGSLIRANLDGSDLMFFSLGGGVGTTARDVALDLSAGRAYVTISGGSSSPKLAYFLTASGAGPINVITTGIPAPEGIDIDEASNAQLAFVPPAQRVDVAITKSVSNLTPTVGTTVDFTLDVTNHGPGDATQIEVVDQLPPGLSLVSSSATAGSFNSATGLWDGFDLTASASETLTLTVNVDTNPPAGTPTGSGDFLGDFTSGATIDGPRSVAFGPDGHLYVALHGTQTGIKRFDGTTGVYIDDFVPSITGSPRGIEFGPDGNLYVCRFDSNHIQRYDGTTGAFMDNFVTSVSVQNGDLRNPFDLVWGPDGDLYVSGRDSPNNMLVKRYDGQTGSYIDTFVTGADNGGLFDPRGLAFGPDGNLYVCSRGTNDIKRYDGTTGAYIDDFVGNVSVPTGLEFGPDDHLYVSLDNSTSWIKRYDGTTGSSMGNFTVSTDNHGVLAFGPDGHLYVPIPFEDRIARFDGFILNRTTVTQAEIDDNLANNSDSQGIDQVVPVAPPFTKTFAPQSIENGGVSTLTFLIDNSANLVDVTNVSFVDNFPAGMIVATPANAFASCGGGTLVAIEGSSSVSFDIPTISAGAFCTVTVDVTGLTDGSLVNVTGDLTSNLGSSGTATATLDVFTCPVQEQLYWADSSEDYIRRDNLDGCVPKDVLTSADGLSGVRGIAVDRVHGKVYWTDSTADEIRRSNLDGTNVEDLITTGLASPRDIALDLVNEKMYWADNSLDVIQRADLDGSNIETLVTAATAGLVSPEGIALAPSLGKIYWVDRSIDKVQRANLDGTNVEDIVTTGLTNPRGLTIDDVSGKMYWVDSTRDEIRRANLDGTSVETVLDTGLTNPVAIALDLENGKIYWSDTSLDRIARVNLDGTNLEEIVTGLTNVEAIDIDEARTSAVTDVAEITVGGPSFALVVPNPLRNAGGTLQLTLQQAGTVSLDVFDVTGRRVRPNERMTLPTGRHSFSLRAADSRRLTPGVYFYRMAAPDKTLRGRFVVLD